jgi:hypothetical protein
VVGKGFGRFPKTYATTESEKQKEYCALFIKEAQKNHGIALN